MRLILSNVAMTRQVDLRRKRSIGNDVLKRVPCIVASFVVVVPVPLNIVRPVNVITNRRSESIREPEGVLIIGRGGQRTYIHN